MAAALTVIALAASAPDAATAVQAARPGGSGPLVWQACPAPTLVPRDSPLRCASLRVPRDYAHPNGPQVT
ncbi:MAG: hypothetical protein QOF44_2567, partial [Streptomyces sp.]|nr:hypothetical protein [Streptomyces sp.]